VPELTDAVLQHRLERILELGFTIQQAGALAESRDSRGNLVDLHDLRRAVRGGCSIEIAFAIFA
jgi:hypothetical protein